MKSPLALTPFYGLLASLALALGPHALRLPWWLTAFAVGLGLWRLHLSREGRKLPSRWVLVTLTVIGIGATIAGFGTIFGRSGGVALLIVLMALKLLETTSRRDAVLLAQLGYFLVITQFLYDQSIPVAAYLALPIVTLTATLVALAREGTPPSPLQALGTAGALLAQSLPVMLILFVFFPRLPSPLWAVPQESAAAVSGLSDSMSPGDLSRLSLSDAVAFRVDFRGDAPPSAQMYWRGPVLTRFDGRTWSAPFPNEYRSAGFEPLDAGVEYTVTLEPHQKRWLFALDLPATVPDKAVLAADFQLLANLPVRNRMRYDMRSHVRYRTELKEAAWERNRALRLPEDGNPRARALAAQWRERHRGDPRAIVNAALAHFRGESFFYTLQPPLLGEDSIDDFLFNTRRGFCEHFSSTFAFLMRAAGVPTRVVTGYQGGEFNPIGNYLIVRQADAHAWAEVWIEGAGWVRVDPTAAVSPSRIQRGIASAVPVGDPLPVLMRAEFNWLRKIHHTWDAAANAWNQWVLGFNDQRQRDLLRRVGMSTPSWQAMGAALLVGTGAVLLGFTALMLWRLRTRPVDPVQRAYARFCRRLARRGLTRNAWEGPRDFARRVAGARPDLAGAVAAISRLYVDIRYGGRADPRALDRLKALVAAFRA
ncbi:MAG: transglutaminase TgpA family protein [Pseudomonadota bacterium]